MHVHTQLDSEDTDTVDTTQSTSHDLLRPSPEALTGYLKAAQAVLVCLDVASDGPEDARRLLGEVTQVGNGRVGLR